jgi:hypothetical protein
MEKAVSKKGRVKKTKKSIDGKEIEMRYNIKERIGRRGK